MMFVAARNLRGCAWHGSMLVRISRSVGANDAIGQSPSRIPRRLVATDCLIERRTVRATPRSWRWRSWRWPNPDLRDSVCGLYCASV